MRRTMCVLLVILALLVPSVAVQAKKGDVGSGKRYMQWNSFVAGIHHGTQISAEGALTLDPAALQTGTDTTGKYNGGTYWYGQYTAPAESIPFVEAIASWQANTPPGTWLELELKALADTVWTKWYSMGVWLEGDDPFLRHSVSGQGDNYGYVATDTLVMSKPAGAVQARITLFTTDPALSPTLRAYGISLVAGEDKPGVVPPAGLVSDLPVPMRSQMIYPDGGNVWCSPTSTTMVLAYWGEVTGNAALIQTVPAVVAGVWDYRYDGGGNWPFNTAYAATFGLEGKVTRLSSLAAAEPWTAAGVPVIASIAFKKGGLTGAPISSTAGHLVVIRGFTAEGNVIVNDPAAPSDDTVRFVYDRLEFETAWLEASNGTVYLIYPQGWPVPTL
ncbi:MAG TPA: peptidase C39 family protein [Symbiobacteriaceae bacterium]|nr:peptidase C39 family protein [Symbiobacteriaceae bacterium]